MAVVGAIRRVRESRPLELGRLLQYGLALASAGGALIHLSAAGDHSSEPVEAALFTVAAIGQLLWAGVVLRSVSGWVLGAGGILSVLLVACWALSRTTGLPIVGGGVEPLGFKDGIAVLLELAVATGAGLLAVVPRAGRAMLVPAGRFAVQTAAVSVAALTVTALVFAPAHSGGHSEAELAGGHHGGTTEGAAGVGHADDQGAHAGGAMTGHGAEASHGEMDHAAGAGGAHPDGADEHDAEAGHGVHEAAGLSHAGHEEGSMDVALASGAASGEGHAGRGAHAAHADGGGNGHSPSGDHSAHGSGSPNGGGQTPEADHGRHDHGGSQPGGDGDAGQGGGKDPEEDERGERNVLDWLIGSVGELREARRLWTTPSG